MSKNDVSDTLDTLIQAGLLAVGSRLTVGRDGGDIFLRNLIVVVDDICGIECYEASSPQAPLMTFPLEATQSAASAVVLHVLTGLVTRAVEYEASALQDSGDHD